MDRRSVLRLVLFVWTVLFVLAFIDPAKVGMDIRMDPRQTFIVFQAAAGVLAVISFGLGFLFEKKTTQRVASRIPLIIAFAMALAFAMLPISAELMPSVE